MSADESVFSKLPDSRPGTRSPRRRSTEARAAGPAPSAPEAAPEEPASAPGATPSPGPESERQPPPAPEPQAPRGLEDAAWAGIAVAAEAATIGVRLANRALEALRDAGERR